MNTWTRQKGYPVLILTRTGSNYTVTQERFLTDPEVKNFLVTVRISRITISSV